MEKWNWNGKEETNFTKDCAGNSGLQLSNSGLSTVAGVCEHGNEFGVTEKGTSSIISN